MRIDININPKKTNEKIKKPEKSNWEKIKDKNLTSLTANSLAGVVWDSVDTTVLSTVGARHNDAAKQNKADNVMSVMARAKSMGTAAWMGASMGPWGAVVGMAIDSANQLVKAYQANVDWRIAALENNFRSLIELEALGMSATDLNR